MNETHRLNSHAVKEWLRKSSRKRSYLNAELGVSSGVLDQMLYAGHIPKEAILNELAKLMGVQVSSLLLPKDEAKSA